MSWQLEAGAAVAALAVYFGVYGLMLLVTRPRPVHPAPATQDLPPQPPAVASLLATGWEFTEDAAEATLLDLGARKFYEFRQPADDPRQTTIHLGHGDEAGLAPYERRVLARVRAVAVGGVVPLTALTFRDAGKSAKWWKALRAEVIADARAQGLSRPRVSPAFLTALLVAAAGVGAIAGLITLHHVVAGGTLKDDFLEPFAVGAFAFLLLGGFAKRDIGERDTPAGREAAAHWLGVRDWLRRDEAFAELPPASVAVWDRYLPYGAALGTTRIASAVIELGMGDRSRVWSSYGGVWHRVRVRYPRRSRYGQSPARLIGYALLRLAVGAGLLKLFTADGLGYLRAGLPTEGSAWIDGIWLLLSVAGLYCVLTGLYALARGILDLATPARVTGQVLWQQVWRVSRGSDDSPGQPLLHYLAIDDGTGDRTTAWALPAKLSGQCEVGQTITATVYPWSRRITAINADSVPADHEVAAT